MLIVLKSVTIDNNDKHLHRIYIVLVVVKEVKIIKSFDGRISDCKTILDKSEITNLSNSRASSKQKAIRAAGIAHNNTNRDNIL